MFQRDESSQTKSSLAAAWGWRWAPGQTGLRELGRDDANVVLSVFTLLCHVSPELLHLVGPRLCIYGKALLSPLPGLQRPNSTLVLWVDAIRGLSEMISDGTFLFVLALFHLA